MNKSFRIAGCNDRELQKLGFCAGNSVELVSKNESGIVFSLNGKTVALDYDSVSKIKFRVKTEKPKEKPKAKVFFG